MQEEGSRGINTAQMWKAFCGVWRTGLTPYACNRWGGELLMVHYQPCTISKKKKKKKEKQVDVVDEEILNDQNF